MSSAQITITQQLDLSSLRKDWYWYVIAGAVMLLGGILAIMKPFAASITVELITGWVFIISGIFQFIQAIRASGESTAFRVWMSLFGVLGLALGISLLMNPVAGLFSLTAAVGILIALSGAIKIYMAFKMRPYQPWLWIFISGLISIALAVFILMDLPKTGMVTLGILLAIDLISSGILWTMIGFRVKKLPE